MPPSKQQFKIAVLNKSTTNCGLEAGSGRGETGSKRVEVYCWRKVQGGHGFYGFGTDAWITAGKGAAIASSRILKWCVLKDVMF